MLNLEGARYSLLEIDDVAFLLPGSEVIHIALRDTIIRAADTSSGIIGQVPLQEHRIPLYALSGGLRLLDILPLERHFAACLRGGDAEFAIACDTIRPFAPSATHLRQPLPAVMALSDSPLRELMLDNERLYCVSDSRALFKYLSTHPLDLHEPESTSLVAE